MSESIPPMSERLKDADLSNIRLLSDRDAASIVLPDLDYESQLIAVHGLLRYNKQVDQQLAEEIEEFGSRAGLTPCFHNLVMYDQWTNRLHDSV